MNTIVSVIAVVILVVILRLTKRFERRVLEPLFMWVALFGIVALCSAIFLWLSVIYLNTTKCLSPF